MRVVNPIFVTLQQKIFIAQEIPSYTFWYLSSQKYQRQSVIIHILRLLRCIMVKIWKMHWKLKYLKSQYCFVNISAMKNHIFMKFYRVINYYLVNISFKFHEDAHVLSRLRVFTTCVRVCMHGSSWNFKLKLTR